MNAIVLICLLSVSQRPAGGFQGGCNGGCCKAGRCAAPAASSHTVKPSPAVIAVNQRQAVLDELFRLRLDIADANRAMLAIPKDMQPSEPNESQSGEKAQSLYGSLPSGLGDVANEPALVDANAAKREQAKEAVADLQRQADRLQAWLVWQKRAAMNGKQYPMPHAPVDAIGKMQAAAVRRGMAGIYGH